jgi:putative membrane protein
VDEQDDPRIFFAAERTLLAWVRTGLAVVGLGFIVARFGLFLRMVAHGGASPESHGTSTLLGVLFVLFGSAGIAFGVFQFLRFCRTLPPNARPDGYWLGGSIWFGALVAATGVSLAAYLLAQMAAI